MYVIQHYNINKWVFRFGSNRFPTISTVVPQHISFSFVKIPGFTPATCTGRGRYLSWSYPENLLLTLARYNHLLSWQICLCYERNNNVNAMITPKHYQIRADLWVVKFCISWTREWSWNFCHQAASYVYTEGRGRPRYESKIEELAK